MFSLFFRYQKDQISRYFRVRPLAKYITVFLFLIVLGGVAYAIYRFFFWEFKLVSLDEYLRGALPLYLNETLFLVVFALVFISAFVTALFNLFRTGNDGWVIASPHFRVVFWYTYIRVLLSSMWPLVVVALPAFLGFRASYHVGVSGVILAVFSMICLVGFAVSLAVILVMLCAHILYFLGTFYKRRFLTIGRVAFFMIIVLAFLSLFTWQRVGTGDIVKIFAPNNAAWTYARTDVILNLFSVFPSHLSAVTLFDLQIKNSYGALLSAVSLLANFAAGFLWVLLVSFLYLPLWQTLQEGKMQAKAFVPGAASRKPIHFPKYLKGSLGALFEKETIVHFREVKNVLWFGFLFFLWLIQTDLGFFIRRNMLQYNASLDMTSALIETFQVVIAAYFVSAFVLRFAFPSFSTERKTAWLLGTAPVDLTKIFWAKLLFYAATFLSMGIALGVVNSFIVNVPLQSALLFLFFIALETLCITILGLGFGTIFPNFETDDPQVLSTSLAGLSFIFSSLIYGGLGAFVFYLFLTKAMFAALAAFIALSVVGAFAVVRFSLQSLRTFEFVKDIS